MARLLFDERGPTARAGHLAFKHHTAVDLDFLDIKLRRLRFCVRDGGLNEFCHRLGAALGGHREERERTGRRLAAHQIGNEAHLARRLAVVAECCGSGDHNYLEGFLAPAASAAALAACAATISPSFCFVSISFCILPPWRTNFWVDVWSFF